MPIVIFAERSCQRRVRIAGCWHIGTNRRVGFCSGLGCHFDGMGSAMVVIPVRGGSCSGGRASWQGRSRRWRLHPRGQSLSGGQIVTPVPEDGSLHDVELSGRDQAAGGPGPAGIGLEGDQHGGRSPTCRSTSRTSSGVGSRNTGSWKSAGHMTKTGSPKTSSRPWAYERSYPAPRRSWLFPEDGRWFGFPRGQARRRECLALHLLANGIDRLEDGRWPFVTEGAARVLPNPPAPHPAGMWVPGDLAPGAARITPRPRPVSGHRRRCPARGR